MPVVQCSCGKQLRVPDQYAGKKVKCPECGQPNAVPAGRPTAATVKASAKPAAARTMASPPPLPAAAPAGKITFQCSCGQAMAAKTEHAGMKTKCPSCTSVVTIPGGAGARTQIATSPAPPVARVKGPPPLDDNGDYYDEDEAPPRPSVKKRKKGSALPWILAGVAALLLVGGGTLTAILLLRGGGGADFDMIPGNAQGFVVVRVADLLNSELGKKIMAEAGKGGQGMTPAQIEEKIGVKLDDIERLIVVVADANQQLGWGVATLSKPVNREKLSASFEAQAEKVQHAGKTLEVFSKGGDRMALCYLSDTMVVAGPEAGVKSAVEMLGGKRPSGSLDDAIKKAQDKHTIFVAGTPPPGTMQPLAANIPPQVSGLKPVLDLQTAALAFDMGSQWSLELNLHYPDDAKAKAAKDGIDGLLAFAKLMAGDGFKQGLPPGAGDDVAKHIKAGMESIKSSQSGPNVTVTMSINGNAIGNALAPFAGMMLPRGGAIQRGPIQPPFGQPPGPANPGKAPRPGPGAPGRPRPAPPGGNPNGGANPGVGLNPGEGGAPGGLVGDIRGSALATQHTNNLKQIALALMLYADAHGGQLPPAVTYGGPDGRTPLYSWRVAILPYLEQDLLYKQFHITEPWDSPHNKTLVARMPKVFALPGGQPGSTTPYQVFVGPNTPWSVDNGRIGPKFPAGFPDGTSNTILVAEAMHPVEWTKPADMVVDPGKHPMLLLGHHIKHNKCYVAMADGSVRSISVVGTSEQTLRNAINPADGQPLDPNFGN
jgi:hypothetical protein